MSSLESPVGNGNYDSYNVPVSGSDDFANEVCRVIGRRRNSGGRALKKICFTRRTIAWKSGLQKKRDLGVNFKERGKHRVEVRRAPWLSMSID
jgi:hypothetical protein